MGDGTVIEIDVERDVLLSDTELSRSPVCIKIPEGILIYVDYTARRLNMSRSSLIRAALVFSLAVRREDFIAFIERTGRMW